MSIRRFCARSLPFAALLALPGALHAQAPADAREAVTIVHVGVVDVERGRVLPDRTVRVAHGGIVAVEPSSAGAGDLPAAGSVVDATGST